MNLIYTDEHSKIDFVVLRQSLIDDDFHNGRNVSQLATSFKNSPIVVYVLDRDKENRCIGTARALSDDVCNCYILDVWTQSQYRKLSIGTKMMQTIIDQVPGQHIYLQSDDSVEFYTSLGFKPQPEGLALVSGEWLKN